MKSSGPKKVSINSASLKLVHTANDPLFAGSSKHDFDTAVRVYMMIEAYHEVIMSQLLIIRV